MYKLEHIIYPHLPVEGAAARLERVGEGEMAVIREAVVDSRAERLRISRLRSINTEYLI